MQRTMDHENIKSAQHQVPTSTIMGTLNLKSSFVIYHYVEGSHFPSKCWFCLYHLLWPSKLFCICHQWSSLPYGQFLLSNIHVHNCIENLLQWNRKTFIAPPQNMHSYYAEVDWLDEQRYPSCVKCPNIFTCLDEYNSSLLIVFMSLLMQTERYINFIETEMTPKPRKMGHSKTKSW